MGRSGVQGTGEPWQYIGRNGKRKCETASTYEIPEGTSHMVVPSASRNVKSDWLSYQWPDLSVWEKTWPKLAYLDIPKIAIFLKTKLSILKFPLS